MKVQIIELESEDDHVSTRDRLSWIRADKAVLVWPRSGRPLAGRLDLTLVQRHARRLGIELALVTYDPQVIASARRIGLPILGSLEQLPHGQWDGAQPLPTEFKRHAPSELAELRAAREAAGDFTAFRLDHRGRVATVAVTAAVMLGAMAAVLPGADIGIQPTAALIDTTIELSIDPNLQSPNASGHLPAATVVSQISGQMQVETTGRIRAPEALAVGEVEFTSLTDQPISIPAGTGLRAGEVRFLTSDDLELEDETASVGIIAAQPGRAGNVSAQTIDSVEGSLGFLVQVSNPAPTSGGRDVLTRAVSEDDRQRLQSALVAELLESGEQVLASAVPSGRAIAPGTIRMIELVEQQFDREAGEIANQISLRMTIEVEGLSFDSAQAERAIGTRLTNSVPAGRFIVPGSLVFIPVSSERDLSGATVQFRVRAGEAHQIDLAAVRRAARGTPSSSIGDVLATRFRLASPPNLDLRPSWLPWMPLLETRIGVDWIWNSG